MSKGKGRNSKSYKLKGQSDTVSEKLLFLDRMMKPLEKSEDSWASKKKKVTEDHKEAAIRKVNIILNKLTPTLYDKLSIKLANYIASVTEEIPADGDKPVNITILIREVVSLIFDKVVGESHYAAMYTRLSRDLNAFLIDLLGTKFGEIAGSLPLSTEEVEALKKQKKVEQLQHFKEYY